MLHLVLIYFWYSNCLQIQRSKNKCSLCVALWWFSTIILYVSVWLCVWSLTHGDALGIYGGGGWKRWNFHIVKAQRTWINTNFVFMDVIIIGWKRKKERKKRRWKANESVLNQLDMYVFFLVVIIACSVKCDEWNGS